VNTGGTYRAEDTTAATFQFDNKTLGTGIWNFNAAEKTDLMTFIGTAGDLATPIFSDTDVIVRHGGDRQVYDVRNPPHVHQPLIQTIVDELRGQGECSSTGASAARTSWVMDRCVHEYYKRARMSG